MNKSLWIIYTVVAGFTGYLLGYSVPSMIETSASENLGGVKVEEQSPADSEDISDYYKELQEIK
jgi:hypothetical protein